MRSGEFRRVAQALTGKSDFEGCTSWLSERAVCLCRIAVIATNVFAIVDTLTFQYLLNHNEGIKAVLVAKSVTDDDGGADADTWCRFAQSRICKTRP